MPIIITPTIGIAKYNPAFSLKNPVILPVIPNPLAPYIYREIKREINKIIFVMIIGKYRLKKLLFSLPL